MVIESTHNWKKVELKFEKSTRNGLYRVSAGISFPDATPFSDNPKGSIVIVGEKDGFYCVLDAVEFDKSPVSDLARLYEQYKFRRLYYNNTGSKRVRLAISRDPAVTFRPSFIEAPYRRPEEAQYEVYTLLNERRLKYDKESLVYNSLRNVKPDSIMLSFYNVITGLLKYS